MSLNLFKTLSDLSGTYSSARNHRARLSPGRKRTPARRRIVLEALEDRTLLSVWVATDQTDYAPGSTAIISGGGYQPGDAITLQVVHTDGNPDVSPANDPWTVTADDSGNISSSWYVDPDSSAGDSLELQANDPATGDRRLPTSPTTASHQQRHDHHRHRHLWTREHPDVPSFYWQFRSVTSRRVTVRSHHARRLNPVEYATYSGGNGPVDCRFTYTATATANRDATRLLLDHRLVGQRRHNPKRYVPRITDVPARLQSAYDGLYAHNLTIYHRCQRSPR